ncbi:MAG TPA: cytochrome C, partial [Vicinamibacteria bacterium]|nr:cytochrome C [Vicinamibacteria bacterium]
MGTATRAREWVRPLVYLGQNPLSLTGAALTTSAALTMVLYWIVELLRDRPSHPYAGILVFLILPGVFVFGLLLVPAGILLRRRRLYRAGA